jgi:hypothetical protein
MRLSRIRSWGVIASAVLGAMALSLAAPVAAHAETSPSGANDWNCKPSFLHPRPMVLVQAWGVAG